MTSDDDFEQRFKGLVSEHVDAQLGGHREPPALRTGGHQGRVLDIRSRLRRRPWALPLLAAACVVLVVGGTAGAVTLLSENGPAPATTNQPTVVDPSRSASSPTPSGTATPTTKTTPNPSTSATRSSASHTPSTSSRAVNSSTAPGTSTRSSTRSYVPPPTSPATARVVIRPVHTDGTPVAGYTVTPEKHDSSFGCFGNPSWAAVDPNIQFCGSSADNTLACWKSRANSVLCLRDATTRVLVRIRTSQPFGSVAAPKHPAPLNLTLHDATACDMRDGGAAGRSSQHPSWVPYYYCADNTKAVYAPTLDDGIDETVSPWTVVVFPISGVGNGRNQSVRTAYFVGTAK